MAENNKMTLVVSLARLRRKESFIEPSPEMEMKRISPIPSQMRSLNQIERSKNLKRLHRRSLSLSQKKKRSSSLKVTAVQMGRKRTSLRDIEIRELHLQLPGQSSLNLTKGLGEATERTRDQSKRMKNSDRQ